MADTSGLITTTLLVNIQWAVMVDACKHFGECMDPDAFTPSPGCRLKWPGSELGMLVMQMRCGVSLDFYTLPRQWQEHALRSNITSTDAPETWVTLDTGDGGGRRDHTGDGDGRGDRGDPGGGHGGRGDGRGQGGGGGDSGGGRGTSTGVTIERPTKARYPERYGSMGQNHNASWNLLKVVKPLSLHGKAID